MTGQMTSEVGEKCGLALHVPLKPFDNKRGYGFTLPHPIPNADVAEASQTAEYGLGSGQLAGVSVERAAEPGEDDIGSGDAQSPFFCPRIVSGATSG